MSTDWVMLMKELGGDCARRAADHDRDDSFVAENYARLREVGAMAAGVPAELGGGGASHAELCAMVAAASPVANTADDPPQLAGLGSYELRWLADDAYLRGTNRLCAELYRMAAGPCAQTDLCDPAGDMPGPGEGCGPGVGPAAGRRRPRLSVAGGAHQQ